MLVFPNCKINIGLRITGQRPDGYHNIETIFYPVQLNDALEIIDSPETVFTQSGILINNDEKDNLCLQAYHLLKQDFAQMPSLKIHLHKSIPIGAGLGGGSANAAFTLTALNEKYSLNLSKAQLISYALQLGSDCPFFILNEPCIGSGRGEILQQVHVTLKGYLLMLINPGIHISTGWAFSQLAGAENKQVLNDVGENSRSMARQPITQWKDMFINDFEKPVFEKYAEISNIKSALYNAGAVFASMSGSGSTVYGIFENSVKPAFDFPPDYLVRAVLL